MTSKQSRSIISLATIAIVASIAATVHAETPSAKSRRPLRATEQRTTELVLDRYQKPFIVERERTEQKTQAVFSAEPQRIEDNAIMLFEISSVSAEGSVARWRCVAVNDVAECLGRAVKIRYLPGDEKMVLSAIAKPKDSAEGIALVEQSKKNRANELVSR